MSIEYKTGPIWENLEPELVKPKVQGLVFRQDLHLWVTAPIRTAAAFGRFLDHAKLEPPYHIYVLLKRLDKDTVGQWLKTGKLMVEHPACDFMIVVQQPHMSGQVGEA
ncbi:MAG TPA: hypothetical protein PLA94_14640 [Myxococcota bacterium]|nr:hypothetical protein [Myxococcota bacterium]